MAPSFLREETLATLVVPASPLVVPANAGTQRCGVVGAPAPVQTCNTRRPSTPPSSQRMLGPRGVGWLGPRPHPCRPVTLVVPASPPSSQHPPRRPSIPPSSQRTLGPRGVGWWGLPHPSRLATLVVPAPPPPRRPSERWEPEAWGGGGSRSRPVVATPALAIVKSYALRRESQDGMGGCCGTLNKPQSQGRSPPAAT